MEVGYMPMDLKEHEKILSQLNNPELSHSDRTDLLQQLRQDYGTVISEYTDLTANVEKLRNENQDLVVSNSKLFRQVGITESQEEEVQKEEFSETVTIEQLEKQALQ
ncbi:capsid assembly scaffolding protein [Bacillus phage Chedec 11]|uniref:Capsid assembly scaffolding protein n=1 Tax=Bacillus phage Chedec 11 TaxID=2932672 RepID=A0A976MZX2_9CAUD|nr:capsid assembly scaffolding protein [Bacillus phage Chedec 11]